MLLHVADAPAARPDAFGAADKRYSLGFTVTRRITLTTFVLLLLLAASAAIVLRTEQGYAAASYAWLKLRGGYSVDERIRMHSGAVERRLKAKFAAVAVPYPPAQLAYIAFKDTAELQVYARASPSAEWRRVHTYPILGMSGDLGPKLRQGDMQVPEGIYRAEFLNANSRFHLSIRLNYPNEFDRAQARAEGRTELGSDIMIHGTAASIGCLAMGNQAAEDLFILAALSGKEQVEIVVAPTDFRRQPVRTPDGTPAWLSALYGNIKAALSRFPSEA
ncbi:L,D-transpeptidase family protein [Accumulibacter sp.]|uniref:L,D-transpeptidase family protein n=1 Tax=Accumulibacter sp. TaxID=2053492 RepID=UPI001AD3C49B|nr:L,D-transpeptidase family protein [Accumulibacter sp.]MBN8452678.1 hypothetical protein [Accumulibacter sp.]